MPTTTDPEAAVARRRQMGIAAAVIGITAGTLSLLRPDGAALILGIALIAVSLLELTAPPPAVTSPSADHGRRLRRLRILAGVGAGLALIVSTVSTSDIEAPAAAVGLAIIGIVETVATWQAGSSGLRGVRASRAALAFAVALVLVTVPSVALGMLILVAAIGWITVGAITLFGIFETRRRPDPSAEPDGVVEVISAWLSRRDIGTDYRGQILDAYDYDPGDRDRLGRFTVLLVLASIIASAGLISNSVASIIGAMIIAPLMGPIVGIALGIVTGLPTRTIRCLIVAVLGIALTVLIGVVMGAWVGTAPGVVSNSEILARTSPNILDLIVALAAGAAGAYAASNAKVADSLPGVAIAIALVPPLGTAGILISHGDWSLAGGALLLFVTNFVSIVLAASVIFVLVGVVPIGRLSQNAARTRGWFATFAVAGVLLVIPLAIGGRQAVLAASQNQLATQVVDGWLAPVPGFEIVSLSLTGDEVDVTVAGQGEPPDPGLLQSQLDDALDTDVTLELRVIPTVVYSSAPSASPSPTAS